MQRGSLALVSRKEGPDVWQFRWSEKDLHGVRVQRKRVIGTVERYPDGAAARTAMTIVLAELNSGVARRKKSLPLGEYHECPWVQRNGSPAFCRRL